jgi:quinate dehydrogenase (quinone)
MATRSESTSPSRLATALRILLGVVMVLAALPLVWMGYELISVGGSWYYGIAGVLLVVAGGLIAAGRKIGVWLYLALFVATVIWAIAESGFAFWPMVPRLGGPLFFLLLVFLIAPFFPGAKAARKGWFAGAALVVVTFAAAGIIAFQPQGVVQNEFAAVPGKPAATSESDWGFYGRTPSGTRHVPFDQITPENVGKLKLAFTYNTGVKAEKVQEEQNTPVIIGDTAYLCTPNNEIHAFNVTTGAQKWIYKSNAEPSLFARCRGVGYYERPAEIASLPLAGDVVEAPASLPTSSDDANGEAIVPAAAPVATKRDLCDRKIIMTASDVKMHIVNADTGEPCAGFGENGVLDLRVGMGESTFPVYTQTSMPTIARGKVIFGGMVLDNQSIEEPSGVIRALDIETGEQLWYWDAGHTGGSNPKDGAYADRSPNVWSTPAFDDANGLLFLPVGNATPDFYGAHRTEDMEKVASAVVALDIDTGKQRWVFQTVHHDLWDYDVASQPALYDVPDGNGGTIPALIQLTKRGQIFMLNRLTGEPIAEVEERPVPAGNAKNEWYAPTQPYSVGMPAIGTDLLTEARMWGMTLYDQLQCRIDFKKMDYVGDFTPPSENKTLVWPGYYGGFNWGSAAIDEDRGMLVVVDMRIGQWVQLVTKPEEGQEFNGKDFHAGLAMQTGTPYAAAKANFESALGIPCNEPPFGTITGIDLNEREVVWQRPLGTLEQTGPKGIKMGMPIPVGMPNVGGPMTTASGLSFFVGTQDYYLRAFNTETGEEVWKSPIPVGSQGTPVSYVSPENGKQYVLFGAGGARQHDLKGDAFYAFALED